MVSSYSSEEPGVVTLGQGTQWADAIAVAATLAMPLVVALLARRSRRIAFDEFTANRGRNGRLAVVGGVVAGNVGVGGFLALFLFTNRSPLIGASVACAYTLGLLACAWLAPRIRARGREAGTIGLADLIASGGGRSTALAVWLPIAVVFVLRSAVQMGALGLIVAGAFGLEPARAIVVCSALLGAYLVVGGYRAAVETDMVQAVVIGVGVAAAGAGLGALTGEAKPLADLDPYGPAFLVGIWLFLPWSAVMAVDNWQRITVAANDRVARDGYAIAAVLFGAIFLVIFLAGYRAPAGSDMIATFRALMPDGVAWLASAMLVACIMSSVDTFIMPLAASLRGARDVMRTRTIVVVLIGLTALVAIAFGDVLTTVVAAFNSLTVFLPAAFGALFLRRPAPRSAAASMILGLAAAIGLTAIVPDMAALIGFAVAASVYVAGRAMRDRFPSPRL